MKTDNEQKQHLIDIMQEDEKLGLYNEEDMKEAFIKGAMTDMFNTWGISDEDMAKEKFVEWFKKYKK